MYHRLSFEYDRLSVSVSGWHESDNVVLGDSSSYVTNYAPPTICQITAQPTTCWVGLSKLTQWNQSTGKPFATLTIPIPLTSVGRFDGVRQWVKTYKKKILTISAWHCQVSASNY